MNYQLKSNFAYMADRYKRYISRIEYLSLTREERMYYEEIEDKPHSGQSPYSIV